MCLVPLLWKAGKFGYAANALRGVVFAFAYYLGTVSWTLNVSGFEPWHLFLVVGFLSISYGFFMIGVRAFSEHSAEVQAVLTGMLWITLEYLRNHAGFLALPWAGLAHAAASTPTALQFASIAGEYGLSFMLVAANTFIASALAVEAGPTASNRRISMLLGGLCLPIFLVSYGAVRLGLYEQGDTVRVLAVHADRSSSLVESHTNGISFAGLTELTADALAGEPPEIVVWPEGSFKLINAYPYIYGSIHEFSEEIDAAVAFGISSGSKYIRKSQAGTAGTMINQLALIDWRSDRVQAFSKQILVPFGEYIPLDDVIPWPEWFIPDMAQFHADDHMSIPKTRRNIQLVPAICWENLFAGAIRSRVPRGRAIGLNISDLSVFRSAQAVQQHNAATLMRAVENGISFVAATNTGPSLLVDPLGRIISSSSPDRPGYVAGSLPTPVNRTPYWYMGDLFVLLAALGLTTWPLWLRREQQGPQPGNKRNTPADG